MSGDWYLTRATLRREQASLKALLPLLAPGRPLSGHHLVWSLCTEGEGMARDFLWRQMETDRFLILSPRQPVDRHGLFEVESKPFRPELAAGDLLGFSLRANPTVTRRMPGKTRGKRHDVVMDAIAPLAEEARAEARSQAILTAGRDWLAAQGEAGGFALADPDAESWWSEDLRIGGYRRLPLEGKRPGAAIGLLDFDGVLTVTDPALFLSKLTAGIGHAKAYGCGLMLIRRLGRS